MRTKQCHVIDFAVPVSYIGLIWLVGSIKRGTLWKWGASIDSTAPNLINVFSVNYVDVFGGRWATGVMPTVLLFCSKRGGGRLMCSLEVDDMKINVIRDSTAPDLINDIVFSINYVDEFGSPWKIEPSKVELAGRCGNQTPRQWPVFTLPLYYGNRKTRASGMVERECRST